MMCDAINKWGEIEIERIKALPSDKLKVILSRPFQPSPFNGSFDFEKWCAVIELCLRDKLNNVGK